MNDVFEKFLKEWEITQEVHEKIQKRFERITSKLDFYYYGKNSYYRTSLQVGSYGRGTAIKGVSDLDMIYILPQEIKRRFDNYETNGQSQLLQEIKTCIKESYPSTEIRGDGQVVVVSFYDGVVEVLPAFKKSDGSFCHLDTHSGGSWKTTNPIPEILAIDDINRKSGGLAFKLCKLLRVWKNEWGVKMNGLLIDSIVGKFLDTVEDFYPNDYAKTIQALFTYITQLKSQRFILAIGSNQQVKIGDKIQKKAKKALKCIEEGEWKKLFGRGFPSIKQESYIFADCAKHVFRKTEEFIEDRFIVNIQYDLTIDCEVRQNGFRPFSLLERLEGMNSYFLKPNKELIFSIKDFDGDEQLGEYKVFWKVLNRGNEAERRDAIRGQIIEGEREHRETTVFQGEHMVECYVVCNNIVVARDRIKVPISGKL